MASFFVIPSIDSLVVKHGRPLSQEALDNHTRLVCIAHLLADMAHCLMEDTQDESNQSEETLTGDEYEEVVISIARRLLTLLGTLKAPLPSLIAACNRPASD